jgi:hypothetical protein
MGINLAYQRLPQQSQQLFINSGGNTVPVYKYAGYNTENKENGYKTVSQLNNLALGSRVAFVGEVR